MPVECPRLGNTNLRSADIPSDQFSSFPAKAPTVWVRLNSCRNCSRMALPVKLTEIYAVQGDATVQAFPENVFGLLALAPALKLLPDTLSVGEADRRCSYSRRFSGRRPAGRLQIKSRVTTPITIHWTASISPGFPICGSCVTTCCNTLWVVR